MQRWRISTMRISLNHVFERRLGIWPAGWDADGEMFCNQRYGDWPYALDQFRADPWAKPEWMLLSYGKAATASSAAEGCTAGNVSSENVRTWWKPTSADTSEWVQLDLGTASDIRAVQINFADDHLDVPLPEGASLTGDIYNSRWIDTVHQPTRWLLEGSLDGECWTTIEDKRNADTDLSHDLIVRADGITFRYLRLAEIAVPYGQVPCVSGLRVFGLGHGALPTAATNVTHRWNGALDLSLSWQGNATGYEVLWGYAPNKLYHSYEVFDTTVHLGGLVNGQEVYLRVDSFNESGITEGTVRKMLR